MRGTRGRDGALIRDSEVIHLLREDRFDEFNERSKGAAPDLHDADLRMLDLRQADSRAQRARGADRRMSLSRQHPGRGDQPLRRLRHPHARPRLTRPARWPGAPRRFPLELSTARAPPPPAAGVPGAYFLSLPLASLPFPPGVADVGGLADG